MSPELLLPSLPDMLRKELFLEFRELGENFSESRWRATGLNAGRFCEVVYSIVEGLDAEIYPNQASKPKDFRSSCRSLENSAKLPKSFRFVVLPALTTLYEIRSTRNVGHVDSAIDPSFMDGSYVLATAKWVMAELVRHFHTLTTSVAQGVVDTLSQYQSPVVWADQEVKRVLSTHLSLDSKILLLLSAAGGRVTRNELFDWLDEGSRPNFNKRLGFLHTKRMIEAKAFGALVQILPPGHARVASILKSEPRLGA